jgi:hypothetical protein
MNRIEAGKIVAAVAARYRGHKQVEDRDDDELEQLLTIWHSVLDDVPYPAASVAFAAWSKEHKWPPDPSEIRDGAIRVIENCGSDQEREAMEPGWLAWRDSLPGRRHLQAASS